MPKRKRLRAEFAAQVGIGGARKIGIGSFFDRRYGGDWVRPRAADVLPTRAFGLINPDQRSTVHPFPRDGISATKVEFARLFPVPDGFPLNRKAAFTATAGQSKIAANAGAHIGAPAPKQCAAVNPKGYSVRPGCTPSVGIDEI